MIPLVEAAGAVVGGAGVTTAAGTALTIRRVRRSNRVLPHERGAAPLTWRWSPTAPARLHRRLVRTARLIVTTTGDDLRPRRRRRRSDASVLADAGRDLLRRAAAADARLADARRHGPAWRPRELRTVSAEVSAIEASTHRLVVLAASLAPADLPTASLPGASADELLDVFEDALRELRA